MVTTQSQWVRALGSSEPLCEWDCSGLRLASRGVGDVPSAAPACKISVSSLCEPVAEYLGIKSPIYMLKGSSKSLPYLVSQAFASGVATVLRNSAVYSIHS
jgi:hypothetical protein